MSLPIPIVICLDNSILRDGLSRILTAENYRVRASVADSDDLLPSKLKVDRSFIALFGGDRNQVLDKTRLHTFQQRFPQCSIVLFLDKCDEDPFLLAESLGVAGVLLNSISSEVLVTSLRLVALGERVYSKPYPTWFRQTADMQVRRLEQLGTSSLVLRESDSSVDEQVSSRSSFDAEANSSKLARRGELSERELQILACLVAGNSNKVIARACNITEATVKVHLKAILRKTEVVNRTQAAIWALSNLPLGEHCHTRLENREHA